MSSVFRHRRFQTIIIPAALILTGLLYVISKNHYQIRNTLSYATRRPPRSARRLLLSSSSVDAGVEPHITNYRAAAEDDAAKRHDHSRAATAAGGVKRCDCVPPMGS